MFWWAIALTIFLGPIWLVQKYLPIEWYQDILDKAFYATSFWVAIVGVLAGWLFTQLHQMLDIKMGNGWRERDRRADVVHRIRVRLFIIIGSAVLLTIVLAMLPVVGNKLPDEIKAYAVGIPFGASAFFIYAVVSMLVWFRGVSRYQRKMIRELEIRNDRDNLIKKLKEVSFSKTDDSSPSIDGQLHQ